MQLQFSECMLGRGNMKVNEKKKKTNLANQKELDF